MPLPETTTEVPEVTETQEQAIEMPKWMAQNAGDNKTNESLSKFKTTDEISNAYLKSVEEIAYLKEGKNFVPGEDSTDEQKRAYLTSIGVPEDANSYKKVDTKLPDGVGYTEEEEQSFDKMAFKLAFTGKQYEAFKEWEENATLARLEKHTEAAKEAAIEAEKFHKKEWGSDYDINYNLMKKGLREFGDDFLKKLGPAGNIPEVINFLVEKGRSVKDDTLLDGELDNKTEYIPGQLNYPSMKGM